MSSPASRPAPAAGDLSPMRRWALNGFLVFHLVAITCWAMPITTPLNAALNEAFRPYLVWTGLFQSWDMFSPSPKTINSYVEATVTYADGKVRIWSFPRMEQLNLTDRYMKERYRKFAEVLKEDMYSAMWPDVARHVALLNNNGSAPVTSVSLVRYWSDIVPRADGEYTPSPWNGYRFFSYAVRPEDLH
jgi:hypothetical protein